MRSSPSKREFPKRIENALEWIIPILNNNQIPYHILGGVASYLYGSKRKVNDIDINIPKSYFPKFCELTKEYIQFGPEFYIDSEWMIQLIALNYKGQLIEITQFEDQRIHDDEHHVWRTFNFSYKDNVVVDWKEFRLHLMNPKALLGYKQFLHGPKQLKDMKAIGKYISQSNREIVSK